MIQKDLIVEKLVEFFNEKLATLSKDSQLVNIFIKPIAARVVNNNLNKVQKALDLIADEQGMIDADGILNDMIDNLVISPVKEEKGLKVGNGSIEINIPFVNKAIHLDKDDIEEFKQKLTQINH